MRISGLATGFDTDSMVKEMMQGYQTKVDNYKKETTIQEYRQQLYRDVLKESQDFYNKHFDVLNKNSIMNASAWETVGFASSDESVVTAKGTAGANIENYKVEVEQLASKASYTLSDDKMKEINKITLKVMVNGEEKTIEVEKLAQKYEADGVTSIPGEFNEKTNDQIVSELNKKLSEAGSDITAKYSEFSKGIVFETKNTGEDQKFNLTLTNKDGVAIEDIEVKGTNAEVKITNNKGEVFNYKGNVNTVTVDKIQFTFNDTNVVKDVDGKVISSTPTKLTGKSDVEGLKNKIVEFVNDYNKIIEGINSKLYEKRDKKYMPLTEEERKAMSEEERKLWDERVKRGLLKNDNDLRRVVDGMKSVMSANMPMLEKIGISPVKNYGEKNGMLTIDEAKLTAALESDPESVKNIFTRDEKSGTGVGVCEGLKKHLYEETVTVTSKLMKKVGMENSVTATNNEYTRNLEKRKSIYEDMLKDLVTKENAFYTKFSRLEKQMSQLNSQQAYLSSQLG